jgi:sugar-specific transcriptional regulator TrmB
MLEAVGISESQEQLYRRLIGEGPSSLEDFSADTGLAVEVLQLELAVLEARGLVSRVAGSDDQFVAVPPDIALESLMVQRREELERAEHGMLQLLHEYRAATDTSRPDRLVEVVTGRGSVVQRFMRLQESAEHEVMICHKPPFAAPSSGPNAIEMRLLGKGVRYRVIYDADLLEDPDELEHMKHHAASGEDSVVLKDVPVKLAIADRRSALVPLTLNDPRVEESALVVHSSTMLDALATLFDMLWERSAPLRLALHGGADATIGTDDSKLLELLAAGLKDEAIARHTSLGLRTVRRRIHRISEALGASSRFQAGVEATKRGWL